MRRAADDKEYQYFSEVVHVGKHVPAVIINRDDGILADGPEG